MANFDIIMPKMGESIEEATITNWFVKEGDKVEEDDVLLEIATDKVDSEIPSPVEGIVKKIFFKQDEVVAVGTVIAVIGLDGDESSDSDVQAEADEEPESPTPAQTPDTEESGDKQLVSSQDRFYSPLVRTIASKEGVSQDELDSIQGSGLKGRVRKEDLLSYLENRGEKKPAPERKAEPTVSAPKPETATETDIAPAPDKLPVQKSVSSGEGDEIIEMSRLRKLIADHMIRSKQTSAHVTNMIEVDVTGVVNWRNRVKEEFLKKEGVKLTYLTVFL